jgi:hypothetical protein
MAEKIQVQQHSGVGLAWIAGWLFTIGYLQMSWGPAILALLIWPYNLGAALAL